jgi:hypothetical protein
MSEFGMPVALELEAARRSGIPAFRREVVHNTTTQNEYRPGELCYIPIDTGAAGAFMDVSCTRLEFVVTVQNKNYFTDFINLPRCGWHSIIQEFGIELNNGLHELNRHYAECVELSMIKKGENRTPFEMTRTNPWKAAHGTAGNLHINFIKPSMVTLTGLPHNTKYAALGTNTSNTTPDFISQSYLYHSQPFVHECFGRLNGGAMPSVQPFYFKDLLMASTSLDASQSVYEDQLNVQSDYYRTNYIGVSSATTVGATANGQFNTTQNIVLGETSHNLISAPLKFIGLPQGNRLRKLARTDVSTASISIYDLVFGQSALGKSPGMWPAGQPCPIRELEKDYQDTIRFINSDNVINYYANVKNIPVGIPVNLDGDSNATSVWGDQAIKTKAAIGQYGHETQFHVCIKLYSSLIGELADRWFPELVVPQGRMRVRIRFQEPNIVFQTLMDPCRRVPGTSRDFIPYFGIVESGILQGGAEVFVGQGQLSEAILANNLASGIHPLMVPNSLAAPASCASVFVDAIALGRYPLPILRMRALHHPFGGTTSGWDAAAPNDAAMDANQYNYTSIEAPNRRGANTGSIVVKNAAVATAVAANTTAIQYAAGTQLAKYAYELAQNQEYGFPSNIQPRDASDPPLLTARRGGAAASAVDTVPSTIGDYQIYSFPTDWSNRYKRPSNDNAVWITTGPLANDDAANPTKTVAAGFANANLYAQSNIPGLQGANQDEWQHSQNWNPFCLPCPQYVPRSSPQNTLATRPILRADYVSEDQLCYGTFLEGATAQVRRTHSSLYPLNVPDLNTSGVYERLTYKVTNVQICTQQIVLPRGTALSIVENALEGGITIECRAWKEMESILPGAESQKHLINMAAAFCTDISFLFRPVSILQGDVSYGYNSFSFYNPFTYFDFEPEVANLAESNYNALGGRPIYYNECIMSTRVAFDIQLQIATELLPRTPIDTVNALIRNCRWGGQVFSDRDYMELNPKILPSYQTSKGMAINTLQDGFWACYTPIHCLDDQTITDNPFFIPLEFSLQRKLRGARASSSSLPIFKPYDGTFHLSFNLEAYMGQSDRLRTGIPIVNNNMFLKMEKAHLLRNTSTQLLTIAQCDAKVVFERGGTVQFFT